MDRWSRRWESGELNKEHVKDILTEVSARKDWPAGGPEQLSGDFYAACMKFAGVPGMPTCASASVQNGDPSKGASILLAKLEAGCLVPWHWHTPNENLMLVSGSGRAEMKGGKAFVLKPGGFAQMPSKHAHQFSCSTVCLLYVYSDAAFDMVGIVRVPDQARVQADR